MNNQKKVSVIIPVYNRLDLAIQAIECALNQDYENIEIIVGDNCSEGDTFEKLFRKFQNEKKIIMFQNERNLGAVKNWIKCMEHSTGDYIKFLWSDDLMSKDYITKAVELMDKKPQAAFIYSSVLIFHDTEQLKDRKKELKIRYRFSHGTQEIEGRKFINKVFREGYSVPVSPGCALFRREKVNITEEIPNCYGYEHKKNGAGTDVLMFLEAVAQNETFIYLDEPLSYFREHPDSITSFDKTIMTGYWTAKKYYIEKRRLNNLATALDTEIINSCLGKKVFSRKRNWDFLKEFYHEANVEHNPLLFQILMYKVRRLVYEWKVQMSK